MHLNTQELDNYKVRLYRYFQRNYIGDNDLGTPEYYHEIFGKVNKAIEDIKYFGKRIEDIIEDGIQ